MADRVRVVPDGDDPDSTLRDEDYETGPGGCGVTFVSAPELPGQHPRVEHCPGKATRTLYGVTVCDSCYQREMENA